MTGQQMAEICRKEYDEYFNMFAPKVAATVDGMEGSSPQDIAKVVFRYAASFSQGLIESVLTEIAKEDRNPPATG